MTVESVEASARSAAPPIPHERPSRLAPKSEDRSQSVPSDCCTILRDEFANVFQYLGQLPHVAVVLTELKQHEAEHHAQRRTSDVTIMLVENSNQFVSNRLRSRNSEVGRYTCANGYQ